LTCVACCSADNPTFIYEKQNSCCFVTSLIWCLNFGIGCSSETETGSDYVPPANESPEEEGHIDGTDGDEE
jgi:hypothetical protein